MNNDFEFNFDNDEFDLTPEEKKDSSYRSPLLSDNDPEYVVNSKEVVKEGAKSILSLIVWGVGALLIILLSIYALFSATLMYLAPAPSEDASVTNRLHIARDTFTAGKIPAGAVVYGSASGVVPSDFLGRMSQGFLGVNDPIVMEVISGPNNILDSTDGKLTIDGKRTNIASTMDRTILDDQFLVSCVSGNCAEGEKFVIDLAGISGQVVGSVDGFSYKQVTSVKDLEG